MKDLAETYLRVRIVIVFVSFVLFLSVLCLRAYHMQVLERGRYLTIAQKQYYERMINLASARGRIYDTHGRELAVSVKVNSLYAQPEKIVNKSATAAKLAPILGKGVDEVNALLSSPKPFVWLQRKITPAQQERIEALHIDGIGFIPESRRFYPNFETASHILGFVGTDSQGLAGIEVAYERELKPTRDHVVLERDALGRLIYIPERQKEMTAPHDLHLTIDLRIQYIAERELRREVIEQGAAGGIAMVMEPATGRVLAMAIYPPFNPNLFEAYDPERWRNRAVTDPFEPGSLMKVFLLAGALNEGITTENDIIYCENGAQQVMGHTIHDITPRGWLSIRDVICYSSNIGSYKMAKKLGGDRYYRYLVAFGFTEATGIDLASESVGEVRPPASWSPVDFAIMSFGQGMAVTPVQVLNALCAIANGGQLMRPYIVERITDENGEVVKENTPVSKRRVLSPEVCKRVTSVMVDVVSKGTGMRASIPGYDVAGKTATAQKFDPKTSSYAKDKAIASFMGFLPAQAPRVAILVVIDEPKRNPYGGATAAPCFRRIAEGVIQHLGIPPSGDQLLKGVTITAGTPSRRTFKEPRWTREGMPDLRGLSMRKALAILEEERVQVRIAGSGILISQQPPPGDPLKEGAVVSLKFAPPR